MRTSSLQKLPYSCRVVCSSDQGSWWYILPCCYWRRCWKIWTFQIIQSKNLQILIILSIYILTTFCETNELAYRQHEEGEHLLIMEEPESGGKYFYWVNELECHDSNNILCEDICRVCRCEGTADRPLFHPCICTGSIKFIHQECLVQWLKYSKKEFCELCNYRFSFTPIYSPDMPQRIPVLLVMSGLLSTVARSVTSGLISVSKSNNLI